jgi:hypothetical protein
MSEQLNKTERWDYERLKALEIRGIDDYRNMRAAEPLTPEHVVAFINQLSPWNLKTSGIFALDSYTHTKVEEAQLQVIDKIFELSPKEKFEDWKPKDAFAFYERLKAYEAQLTSITQDKTGGSE